MWKINLQLLLYAAAGLGNLQWNFKVNLYGELFMSLQDLFLVCLDGDPLRKD